MSDVYNDHTQLVLALAKPASQIVLTLTAKHVDLIHGAIGLMGEAVEFVAAYANNDDQNMLEEAGDILFYGRMIELNLGHQDEFDLVHIKEAYTKPMLREEWSKEMLYQAGEVLDKVKKKTIYNKDVLSSEILLALYKCYYCLDVVIGSSDFTLNEAREANIAKLQKRYSSGSYSDAQAQARADKANADENGDDNPGRVPDPE